MRDRWQFLESSRSRLIAFGILAIALIGGCLALSQCQGLNFRPITEPTPQSALPAASGLATAGALEIRVTATPTIVATSGRACIYSAPWINAAATPIPDGGKSAHQGYPCVDGLWYVGYKDIINGQGNWGKDGIAEDVYVEYDQNGKVRNRIFIINGTRVPGPTN